MTLAVILDSSDIKLDSRTIETERDLEEVTMAVREILIQKGLINERTRLERSTIGEDQELLYLIELDKNEGMQGLDGVRASVATIRYVDGRIVVGLNQGIPVGQRDEIYRSLSR
jgi:hypothetical protein|tara:strand:+ start:321 stop:662 length:342 start_codon:yes stop_codon:yes gene_type:complete